jgi:hypothetical protein
MYRCTYTTDAGVRVVGVATTPASRVGHAIPRCAPCGKVSLTYTRDGVAGSNNSKNDGWCGVVVMSWLLGVTRVIGVITSASFRTRLRWISSTVWYVVSELVCK